MTTVKGCRHRPKCVRGTAGALLKHHPSKELSKEAYEFGCKALKAAAEMRPLSELRITQEKRVPNA